jgi:hypothetical protein
MPDHVPDGGCRQAEPAAKAAIGLKMHPKGAPAQPSFFLPAAKKRMALLMAYLLVGCAQAEVRVFVQASNAVAYIEYECTAGEVVRAFALDVSVDRGQIIGISEFFRGESKAGATGYGIFPASLRDHITIAGGTNIDWEANGYTPLAVVGDNPGGTLPGLGSAGVTLEFGGLWDPSVPSAVPGPTGILCALTLSQPANVSVAANGIRGGVVSTVPGELIKPVFVGAAVGPAIIKATLENGAMNITFQGGELQTATTIDGKWTDTGDVSGNHVEVIGTNRMKFYRVRSGP